MTGIERDGLKNKKYLY